MKLLDKICAITVPQQSPLPLGERDDSPKLINSAIIA
jgi:hypothetical protein